MSDWRDWRWTRKSRPVERGEVFIASIGCIDAARSLLLCRLFIRVQRLSRPAPRPSASIHRLTTRCLGAGLEGPRSHRRRRPSTPSVDVSAARQIVERHSRAATPRHAVVLSVKWCWGVSLSVFPEGGGVFCSSLLRPHASPRTAGIALLLLLLLPIDAAGRSSAEVFEGRRRPAARSAR